jgi:O-methyltransferase
MIPALAGRSARIEALKQAITGFDHLGEGEPFDAFNVLAHYNREQSQWRIPRADVPLTLLSKGQLDLLERAVLDVEASGIAGDFIEAGVWRGGAIILMRALLDVYAVTGRQVIAADSFRGIPKNTQFKHDPVDLWEDRWEAGIDEVRDNIARHGLLDERIEFVEGYFADTLPALTDRQFALIRLDSDSYDSVLTSLEYLYPQLSPGGIIIIDDWHLPGCRFAVDRYRADQGITEPMHTDSGNGYWIKEG